MASDFTVSRILVFSSENVIRFEKFQRLFLLGAINAIGSF
jgi:hypothetical protein